MRVMVLVKATRDSEAGTMPTTELLTAMGRFNEELAQAGILLAGEGLKPSSAGHRVVFGGGERRVESGPFAATTELVAGFWLWQVKDMEEALAWAKRCPDPMPDGGTLEIRPLYEMADFGEAMTPELAEAEERLRPASPRH
ncbi:YciI family protein [Sabulicella glaciei]|uniref:YciI family protein n=1 Tax=Sabulicella glaciei TaxID=2984948 RepID=A0ABT3NV31_9PROT|nr:YciI family protein [Roseococcus sp. MDT2-1-1]MCW8086021.1 YciI family protein [Roseococcus sp. MDT2-1-1]